MVDFFLRLEQKTINYSILTETTQSHKLAGRSTHDLHFYDKIYTKNRAFLGPKVVIANSGQFNTRKTSVNDTYLSSQDTERRKARSSMLSL